MIIVDNLNRKLDLPVSGLYVDTVSVKPVTVDGWDGDKLINDEWSFWQSASYDVGTREVTIVTTGHGTIARVRDDAGRTFDPNDSDSVDDYKEDSRNEDGEPADEHALTDEELSALEDADSVYEYAEGPMMNYWYPVDVRDPIAAALAISGPLCVVEVDGSTGLALTGGGMDLSWEIAQAFCEIGQLPPVHFDLPGMAFGNDGQAAVRRYVLEAMLRSLEVATQQTQSQTDRLRQRFAAMLTEAQA